MLPKLRFILTGLLSGRSNNVSYSQTRRCTSLHFFNRTNRLFSHFAALSAKLSHFKFVVVGKVFKIVLFTPILPPSNYYNPGYSPNYKNTSYRRESAGTNYNRYKSDDSRSSNYNRQTSDERKSLPRPYSDDQRSPRRESHEGDRPKRKTSTRNVIYSEQDVGKIMTRAYDPGLLVL